MDQKKYFSKEELSDLLDVSIKKLEPMLAGRRVYEGEKYSDQTLYATIDALASQTREKKKGKYFFKQREQSEYVITKKDREALFRAADILNVTISASGMGKDGRTGEYDAWMNFEFSWQEQPKEVRGVQRTRPKITMVYQQTYSSLAGREVEEEETFLKRAVDSHNAEIEKRKQTPQPGTPTQI